MVIFNGQALIAGAFAFVCGFGMFSWSRRYSAAWLTGLISLIAFDFSMRIRNDDEGTPLLAPNAGGHLCLFPCGSWACLV